MASEQDFLPLALNYGTFFHVFIFILFLFFPAFVKQSVLTDQCDLGIRFLDLRIARKSSGGSKLFFAHGIYTLMTVKVHTLTHIQQPLLTLYIVLSLNSSYLEEIEYTIWLCVCVGGSGRIGYLVGCSSKRDRNHFLHTFWIADWWRSRRPCGVHRHTVWKETLLLTGNWAGRERQRWGIVSYLAFGLKTRHLKTSP